MDGRGPPPTWTRPGFLPPESGGGLRPVGQRDGLEGNAAFRRPLPSPLGAAAAAAPAASPSLVPTPLASPSGAPRRVCVCGTTLLFPGEVSVRTCWNCQTVVDLRRGQAALPNVAPLWPAAGPGQALGLGAAAAGPGLLRPAKLPAALAPAAPAAPGGAGTWGAGRLVLSLCLAASLASNAYLGVRLVETGALDPPVAPRPVPGRSAEEMPRGSRAASSAGGDKDGDGIPDHHDFCPDLCAPGANCSKDGWLSGPVQDFDGDGCQDGVEDLDKDGDGIKDADDHCPLTPQQYTFISNSLSDSDSDGCADGVEDHDNDNDGILNAEDACPRTNLVQGEKADGAGCTTHQRRFAVRGEDTRWWETAAGGVGAGTGVAASPMALVPAARLATAAATAPLRLEPTAASQSPLTWKVWLEEWKEVFKGAWVEVIVGAFFSVAMTQIHRRATAISNQTNEVVR